MTKEKQMHPPTFGAALLDENLALQDRVAELEKWFLKLVTFVRGDQCTKLDPKADCPCCTAYLEVAENCSSRARLEPAQPSGKGEER